MRLIRCWIVGSQVALLSATMPMEILKLSEQFMQGPAKILNKKQEIPLEGIKQFYIPLEKEEWKLETLLELFRNLDITQCIIFCNKKGRVDDLKNKMRENEFTVSALHGEKNNGQDVREVIMK